MYLGTIGICLIYMSLEICVLYIYIYIYIYKLFAAEFLSAPGLAG